MSHHILCFRFINRVTNTRHQKELQSSESSRVQEPCVSFGSTLSIHPKRTALCAASSLERLLEEAYCVGTGMMHGLLHVLLLLLLSTAAAAFGVVTPRSTFRRWTRLSAGAAADPNQDTKIPIHLLAGFLGSGKTTTLKHLLENTENTKIGVIVNDVASVNIDVKLVNKRAENGVMELQNGCACCSLADELLTSMENLLKVGDFDAVIVELSGVADPVAIFNNWKQAVHTQSHPAVTNTASLENVVTLVDACTFGTDFMTWDVVGKRWTLEDGDCTANRQVVELLAEQVEAANLIILNKQDMATPQEVEIATSMVKSLNEKAKLLTTSFGKVSASQILELAKSSDDVVCEDPDCNDTSHSHGHNDHEASDCSDPDCNDNSHSHSHSHAAADCTDPDCTDSSHSHSHSHNDKVSCADPDCTDKSHSHSHSHHATDVDNLGISSFVYKSTRPFHAQRLMQILFAWPIPNKDELDFDLLKEGYPEQTKDSPFVGVLRSKGFVWLAPTNWEGVLQDAWRSNTAMYWSHAGKHLGVQQAGPFWASVDRQMMKDFFAENPKEYERVLAEDFVSEEFGDRRQELVFIGMDLQEDKIREALDACLLNDEELEDYRAQVAKLQKAIEA